MTNTQLKNFRKIAKRNAIYNEDSKTLTIKTGRMAGIYAPIEKASAIEIVKAN